MSQQMESDHERIRQYAARAREQAQATRTAVKRVFERNRLVNEEAAAAIRRANESLDVIRATRRHLVAREEAPAASNNRAPRPAAEED